ncbi:MerR family DNA-binding protein [Euryhalocaulis caribicus]|uniref:MerR family DNA-binding protein n=1 Tax=Euryhalocaulis caribicus TaxID=1161401 RepID=UPI0003B48AA1|nr:MerR family DNA-binding protein [Euryhalocaulis caribicus]
MAKSLTIGRAARQAGVSVETIRFYERKGLLEQPARPAGGGYRAYPADAIRKLQFIKQAQGLGFSLREIHDLLALRSDPAAQCDEVRAKTQTKLEDVEKKIARLQAMRDALVAMVESCPREGAASDRCTILKFLDSEGLSDVA